MSAVQDDPIPPVPNQQEILEKVEGSTKVSIPWSQWFTQLREKINILNSSIVNLAGVVGTGFLAKDGASWNIRTITGVATRTQVTNGDGAAGDPVVDLVDTAVTPGSYTNANLTIGADGRVTAAGNGTPGSGFDPTVSAVIYEDFARQLTTSTATGTSFVTTSTPVAYTANSGSSDIVGSTFGTGAVRLITNSGSTAYARLWSTAGANISLNTSAGIATVIHRFFLNQLSTAGDRFSFQTGLYDVISGTNNNRITAIYSDNLNSGNWVLSIINAGASSSFNTTIPAVTPTYITIKLVIDQAAATCDLYVDGVLGVSGTGVPTGVNMGMVSMLTKSIGTTSMIVGVDYHYLERPR